MILPIFLRLLLCISIGVFALTLHANESHSDRVFDLYYNDQYEEAFPQMLSLAKSGNKEAQGAVARMFLNGWGTSEDERAAFYWASRGAESNESESEAVLGWIYWAGAAGFEQDYEKSLYWYKRAVSRDDNLGALRALTNLHLELLNIENAEALTERLVSKGDFSTVANLATSLEEYASQTFGDEVEKFLDKSLKWAEIGASNSDPESLRFLGDIYFWGTHSQNVDEFRAVEFFLKSSSLGDPTSFARLANAYLNGDQIKQDPTKGELYLLKAEGLGDIWAKYTLARGYIFGFRSITINPDEGYLRLRELRESESYFSKLLEGELYLLGEDRPSNHQKGLLLILQSIVEEEKAQSRDYVRLYGSSGALKIIEAFEYLFPAEELDSHKLPAHLRLAWERIFWGDLGKKSYKKLAEKFTLQQREDSEKITLLELVKSTIIFLESRRSKFGPIESIDLIDEGWAQFIGRRGLVNEPLAQVLTEEGLRLAIREGNKTLINHARNNLGVILFGAINKGVRNVRLAQIHIYDGQHADNLLWDHYLGKLTLSQEEFNRYREQYFSEEGKTHRTINLPPFPDQVGGNPLSSIEFLKTQYSEGEEELAVQIAFIYEDVIGTQEAFKEAAFWYERAKNTERAARANLISEGRFEPEMPNLFGTVYQLFEVDLVKTRGGLLTSLSSAIAPNQDGSQKVRSGSNMKLSALVIGNATYQGAELRNSTNDAKAISEVFEKLGFEVTTGYNLNRRNFKKTLIEFSERAKDSDVTLFFYAGHGVQLGGVNYLLPTDIDFNTSESVITYDGFSLNDLRRSGLPGKTKVLFLDACRNNPFKPALRGSGGEGLAPMNVSRGTLISFATKDGAFSFDGLGGDHSPYTQALLKHLNDPEDIEIMLRSVGDEVMRLTRNRQEPWKYGALTTGQLILPSLRH